MFVTTTNIKFNVKAVAINFATKHDRVLVVASKDKQS